MKKRKTSSQRVKLGRRPLSSPKIDRQTILECGLRLAKKIPLQNISVVRVATDLGVTAASIRYHLRGRDALTAGIVNMFYKDLLVRWPSIQDNWKKDIAAVTDLIFDSYLRYPGITAHFGAENRIQILSSAIKADVDSTMPLFLERYFAIFAEAGLNESRTASYAIILLQLIHMAAHATLRHQWPRENKLMEAHLRNLDPDKFPQTARLRESYIKMEGRAALDAALHLVMSGLEQERMRSAVKT